MKRSALIVAFLFLLLQAGYSATPQSTAFTYQGALSENGLPANGNYDLIFKLFDAETIGNQVGSTITKTSFPVASGKFTVDLDFLAHLWIFDLKQLQFGYHEQVQPAATCASYAAFLFRL